MIYLSISVSALTFNSKLYYTAFKQDTTSYQQWQEVTGFPWTLSKIGAPSGSASYMMFCAFKTNEIILDGKIIVITITLNDILPNDIVVNGVGQLDSSTLVTNSTIYPSALKALSYGQEIIATTKKLNGNSTTITTTFRASGYINQYPIIWYDYVDRQNLNTAITMANCSLYESVEDAAGSGTTPEEMREVLSSWGEEELIPGIGQEVGDQIEEKVPEAVEDALNNHDQQQESQAGTKINEFKEQLQETIDPYFENTTEIRDALHGGLTGVFGYSGTNAVITFPAANNPLADGAQLWPELTVDLGYWWNRLPAALRSMITIYATFVILYCCLSEMLDTINTILIHREILGKPDD